MRKKQSVPPTRAVTGSDPVSLVADPHALGSPRIPGRWKLIAGAILVAVATLALMLVTSPRLAIVWDEGYTLGREARIRDWVRALLDPARFASTWRPPSLELVQDDGMRPPTPPEIDTRAELLGPRAMHWFWPFGREEPHGHPPFYAILGMAGDLLAPGWQALPRARVGPILAFSLVAGALYASLARRFGPWPAALGAGAWVLQPQLFGHGHYATTDGPLASLWVGATLAFAEAAIPPTTVPGATGARRPPPRWRWVVVFGVLAGWAADTKLTGWFLPVPLLAWTALYRSRRGAWTLAVGGVLAVATLYAFNPPWWSDPVGGVERFLRSNLTRGRTIPIPVQFFGRTYLTPVESLPWYNSLAWTAIATPVGFLTLTVAGLARAAGRARSESLGVLFVLGFAAPLVLRALPHTPGHDGVRQLLPALGGLALVASLGAASAIERLGRWGKLVIIAALAEGAAGVALMMPVPLSYFSPAVGGLPGATSLGMEPTYFWDALSDDALDWLDLNTPPGQKVKFATEPTSWLYLRDTGRLRPGFLPWEPGRYAWYVLQNRPGAFWPFDRALIDEVEPVFVVRKWGVPLVWIFPYGEFEVRQRRPSP